MDSGSLVLRPEHLTPHDLVTYSRCPFEMEVLRARRASLHSPTAVPACTPADVIPERHSPLFSPPLVHLVVNDGRLDLLPHDTLVYEDEGEEDLPVLFAPEQVRPDPRFQGHGGNLLDDELGLSGRPDYIVRRADGSLYPIEYKATHLFTGYHESHGRAFDAIQAIAECRLVHAATGVRPTHGVVLYGDVAGDGQHEGWVEIPYGASEEHWLRAALTQIRSDRIRPPVPAERNCSGCEANRDGLCRYAAARYDGPHRVAGFHPTFR
jgi:hypothetical protein